MATVTATPGATDANSYLTVAEADAFAGARLQADNWNQAAEYDKDSALIQATARIDELVFTGYKISSGQALKWPRYSAFDEDGYEYPGDVIIPIVQRATFETALWLLNQNAATTDALAPTGLEAFTQATVGPISVTVDKSFRAGSLPDTITRILRQVLAPGASGGLVMAELLRS